VGKTAAEAAVELAIEPTVQQCVAHFIARQQARAIIASLRKRAEGIAAQSSDELKWINRQLHEPTMKLRKGLYVNEDEFIVRLESELHPMYCSRQEWRTILVH